MIFIIDIVFGILHKDQFHSIVKHHLIILKNLQACMHQEKIKIILKLNKNNQVIQHESLIFNQKLYKKRLLPKNKNQYSKNLNFYRLIN